MRTMMRLRSESLHESFLYSHAPVKREQELRESGLDIPSQLSSKFEAAQSWCVAVKHEWELESVLNSRPYFHRGFYFSF
jgi:hypothetical protein